jgi:hypothetical protein
VVEAASVRRFLDGCHLSAVGGVYVGFRIGAWLRQLQSLCVAGLEAFDRVQSNFIEPGVGNDGCLWSMEQFDGITKESHGANAVLQVASNLVQ